ncbi:MAG: hypothetical protein ACJATI_001045 [Halioglobus sp.]|jgi:hypothetical protein
MNITKIIILLFFSQALWSQNECQNNLISNPNFDNLSSNQFGSYSFMWASNGWSSMRLNQTSSLKFYNENQGLNPAWNPRPPSGNYAALWIQNWSSSSTVKRQGIINELTTPIGQNTGTYLMTFTYSCLNDCNGSGGNSINKPEISIFGINNPSNNVPLNVSTSHLPSNTDLFGSANTTLLSTFTVNESCGDELYVWSSYLQIYSPDERGTKYSASIEIDMNNMSHEITHIMLTHSDQVLSHAEGYIGVDNFCLSSLEDRPMEDVCCKCCEDLQKENQQLTAQLQKCCSINPKCCNKPKPKPKPSPRPGVLTPVKPNPALGSIVDKCCICCNNLEKENVELKAQIRMCCKSKPDSGVLIPIKKNKKG